MTVVPWANGQVLTAGSLYIIPQYYGTVTSAGATVASGNTFTSVGSMFVSGALFAEKLIVSFSSKGDNPGAAGDLDVWQLFTSGAGIAGSIVSTTYTTNAAAEKFHSPIVEIGSNGGWIPGSACVLFVQAKTNRGGWNINTEHLTVWGTGKP